MVRWLEEQAENLDTSDDCADEILPRLGKTGLLRVGVAPADGSICDAIEVVASLAEYSMTAAFVFWSQRAFIECLVNGTSHRLRSELLGRLYRGEVAGAVGLSNAMRFLTRMEPLQVTASEHGERDGMRYFALQGRLPWATNIRMAEFVVAIAAARVEGEEPAIYAVRGGDAALIRAERVDLIGLQASNTAALEFNGAVVDESSMISTDAAKFLAKVRPAFLGLQCGLSIGLARRCLRAVAHASPHVEATLGNDAFALDGELKDLTQQLFDGISDGKFALEPQGLFRIRIRLADVVDSATRLDLQATGARAYVRGAATGVARRRREAMFIPIVTPSIVQLQAQLKG
ncbi:acyl-CoA dehydrogenase [Paraburkholderia sp. 5N]|uniref:Acyl-CoA dehydrogenase n=2 Tax=Paraburkholderia elongata TaxID=2675747 RepID=A0A972SF85_9BURK|nr:acyl-CoA dehydrogenase [Paraburkholderia elongata]